MYLFINKHRITEWLKLEDIWRSSGPIPLLKQGHLQQVAQDHVQMNFEDLQPGILRNLTRQPVLVLSHLHSKVLPSVYTQFENSKSTFYNGNIAGHASRSLWDEI